LQILIDWLQEYWAQKDELSEYPHELHAALSKDGWIGIALAEDLGGAGLGISEATMMLHTIAECVQSYATSNKPSCPGLDCSQLTMRRSGAGLAGAQSIHANVYATQVCCTFWLNLQF